MVRADATKALKDPLGLKVTGISFDGRERGTAAAARNPATKLALQVRLAQDGLNFRHVAREISKADQCKNSRSSLLFTRGLYHEAFGFLGSQQTCKGGAIHPCHLVRNLFES